MLEQSQDEKNRIIEDPEKQAAIGISFFKQVADYAQEKGVYFSIEANPSIYGTNYINTHLEAINLIKEVNHPHFRLNLDLGTMIENQEDVLSTLEMALPYTQHIHISEPYLEVIQERPLHQQLRDCLEQHKYQHVVSIEMKNPGNTATVLATLDYVAKLFDRR